MLGNGLIIVMMVLDIQKSYILLDGFMTPETPYKVV